MVEFIQQIISGAAIGCVYALVALGFVLVYKTTEVVNFAQGELMMVGAFFAFTFIVLVGLPFWLGAILAVVAMAGLGTVVDRVVIRPLVGQPVFALFMVTLGVGILLRSIAGMVPGWGADTHALPTPFANQVVSVGRLTISQEHVAIIVLTALLVSLLFAFFRFSRLGIAMQAVQQNQLAASYMGIPVKRVFALTWALSAAVAGFAGVLLAPIAFVHVNMGFIGLKAFPAAVLGGFGSVPGAIAGGLIIGIVEALAGFYLPEGFKDVAAYVVLLAVLIVRPQGLFGVSTKRRV
jgi:branched-chain amino acid transport system permease protein